MCFLLEKLLSTEKKFGEGLSQLESADKGIIESITLLSTSSNEDLAKLRKDIDESKNVLTSEVEKLKELAGENGDHLKTLEPRVRTNEDQIKHVDDTLDGLKKSLDGLASQQSEAANTAAELNVLINNTQVQLKKQGFWAERGYDNAVLQKVQRYVPFLHKFNVQRLSDTIAVRAM